jgi:hypothetical protein
MATRDEVIAKLRGARHRLQGALDRFYGHDLSDDPVALEAEALDVSVPIRVLVHHNPPNRTVALLSHLDASYMDKPIHFRPLISPPPRTLPSGIQTMSVTIPVNIVMSTGTAEARGFTKFLRYKGEKIPSASLSNWWNDPVWDSGSNRVSNRDLVLAFANKEGGAHVNDDMAHKYRAAKDQGHLHLGGKQVSDLARLGSLVGIAGDELLEYIRDNYPDV